MCALCWLLCVHFGTMPCDFRSRLNDTKRRKHVVITHSTATTYCELQLNRNNNNNNNKIRSMAFTRSLAFTSQCQLLYWVCNASNNGQDEMRECSVKRKIHYCNTVCEFFPAMCHISRWPYAIRSLPFMRVMHAVCCLAYAISIKCLFFLLSFSISSSHRTSLAFYHRINAGVVVVVVAVVCGMRRLCLCLHATVAGIHL